MDRSARVAKALLDVGALKFDGANPFVYASSKIGPVYLDLRRLPSNPKDWAVVVDELTQLIERKTPSSSFQVVSGGEVADLLFSIPVSMQLGKPHIVVRKAAKTHGLGGRIAGVLQKGQRVVHVSDLITSGTSALDWVGVIREAGGEVSDYFVVVDRMQGGVDALGAKGVNVHSLVSLDEGFIETAREQGLLETESASGVVSYLKDPEKWAEELLIARPEILARHIAVENGMLVRKEGLEILTVGYPALLERLGEFVRKKLRSMGLNEKVNSVRYVP